MLWRQRRWRHLLNLIDHLPANSHMNALLSNDDEYAAMVHADMKAAERAGHNLSTGPSWATWSPEVNMLAVVVDRLAAVVESNSAKPKRVVPYARPRTAFDRLEALEQQRIHEHLVAGLVPNA